MSSKSDAELVDAARKGNVEAFGTLARRYQRRIYHVVLHLLRNADDAEEVTQEALVRAFAALDRFDGRSQPFTWMYRIAVNLSLNTIRSRKVRRPAGSPEDPRIAELLVDRPGSSVNPAQAAADRQHAQTLCEAIDALTDTLRTTLVLVVIDGLSHAEVADVLGCPVGTIGWRVHEARRRLRKYLGDRGFGREGPLS